jgi:hypothetical protein
MGSVISVRLTQPKVRGLMDSILSVLRLPPNKDTSLTIYFTFPDQVEQGVDCLSQLRHLGRLAEAGSGADY